MCKCFLVHQPLFVQGMEPGNGLFIRFCHRRIYNISVVDYEMIDIIQLSEGSE